MPTHQKEKKSLRHEHVTLALRSHPPVECITVMGAGSTGQGDTQLSTAEGLWEGQSKELSNPYVATNPILIRVV